MKNHAICFSKSSENLIFVHVFGHQKAEIDTRNMKINRGQETHPMTGNARYEMYWSIFFFIFCQISGHRKSKIDGRNMQLNRVNKLTSYGLMPSWNWIEPIVLSKSSRKFVYKRTHRRTHGRIQYTPFHLQWRGGIRESDDKTPQCLEFAKFVLRLVRQFWNMASV